MIPTVVHRIWLGSPVPAELEDRWDRWEGLGYERRTWRERDLDQLGMPRHFGAARTFAERSDIARLEILHAVGGVYADCDVVPLRRPHDITDEQDRVVCFEERHGIVCNGLLMAEPGTLGFIRRFTRLNARRNRPDAAPNVRTGPFALTAALDYERSRGTPGIRVHPPERLDLDEGAAPDAVARIRLEDDPHWLACTPTAEPPARDWAFAAQLTLVRLRRRAGRTGPVHRSGD